MADDEIAAGETPEASTPVPSKGDMPEQAPPPTGTSDDPSRQALDEAEKWKSLAKKHEKDYRTANSELEKLRKASMSESEKAVAEARAEGRKEALAEATSRLASAELRAVAAGKLADPDDAAALIGDLSQFVTADGDVNTKAMTSAIDALVKAKPYLAPQKATAAPLPGGGATPSNGFSMDSFIRDRARPH